MTSRVLGIDPGITGGLGLLAGDKLEGCWDIPVAGGVNPDELLRIIRNANPTMAVIERASSRPGQGVADIDAWNSQLPAAEKIPDAERPDQVFAPARLDEAAVATLVSG
jgi:hypothetical protein